jgi:hypothetical protein
MARRTRMRTRRPRTRRSRTRRPRTGKKSRGKMRRRTRRPRRISKRFFMRGGNNKTNIKLVNLLNETIAIKGLDKRGENGEPVPGTEPKHEKSTVLPNHYLVVQNPDGDYLTKFTINKDKDKSNYLEFKLNTGENCLVVITGDNDNTNLDSLKQKIPELKSHLKPIEGTTTNGQVDFNLHKAPAGPENGDTPDGKMNYKSMVSSTLKNAGYISQLETNVQPQQPETNVQTQ